MTIVGDKIATKAPCETVEHSWLGYQLKGNVCYCNGTDLCNAGWTFLSVIFIILSFTFFLFLDWTCKNECKNPATSVWQQIRDYGSEMLKKFNQLFG